MGSAIGSIKNVKIFVLYLMQNVGKPLDFITLNDIVMQTDYIMYLDFAEAFHMMLDDGLIRVASAEGEDPLYEITDQGRCVAETLSSDILSSILDRSLAAALRYLDFSARGVSCRAEYSRREDGRYDFRCTLVEKGEPLFTTTLIVDSEDRARRLKDNFYNRPEVVYRGIHALLAGNMNFLLDDSPFVNKL